MNITKLLSAREIAIIIFLFIGVHLLFGCGNSKKAHDAAKALAELDNYSHSPEQFLAILDKLHENHPNYSQLKIADGIARTWNGFNNVKKDISMYTVATDVTRLSEKYKGADFSEVLASYMLRKTFRLDQP